METKAKHTPGPWELIAESVEDSRGNSIAMVTGGSGRQYVEDEVNAECLANACLIAAAPELLEALEMALYYYESFRDKSPTGETETDDIAIIRAAIRKAKGE